MLILIWRRWWWSPLQGVNEEIVHNAEAIAKLFEGQFGIDVSLLHSTLASRTETSPHSATATISSNGHCLKAEPNCDSDDDDDRMEEENEAAAAKTFKSLMGIMSGDGDSSSSSNTIGGAKMALFGQLVGLWSSLQAQC